MSIPIPRRLLIHTATGCKPGAIDPYGNRQETEYTLEKVRFEPSKKLSHQNDGEFREDKYTLFIDERNSIVSDEIATNDKIKFLTETLVVRQIDNLYDERGLHHKEVYLW